jgi:phosphatidylserine decarboxylase
MSLGEKLYFWQQLTRSFDAIGGILPTSAGAARCLLAEVARRRGPRRILEVGAGTGAITRQLLKILRPEDQVVLCEMHPPFVDYLRRLLETDPLFRARSSQITLEPRSVLDLPQDLRFDFIVSSIPFTRCPPALIVEIFERYRVLLRPGGVLSYLEYAFLRDLWRRFAPRHQKRERWEVDRALMRYLRLYQFRRDTVLANLPPVWVRHLRFTEASPAEALTVEPLEHHRLGVGPLGVVDDALAPVAGLSGLGWLLRRTPFWPAPLLAAGLVAWFLRDPERSLWPDPDRVYSACDGTVLAVEQVEDLAAGEGLWVRISAFLSVTDAHVNRAPVAGRVVRVLRRPGGHLQAFRPEAADNACTYLVLEGVNGPCVVVQRAGMVARRIVTWPRPGELLAQGERFGLIRFGSRTDVYLPADRVEVLVRPGQRVYAGRTVLARYRRTESSTGGTNR